ncbi:MAG: TIGR01212 family radical SAM protein [Candidatus Omnitrophica bacterium]|nr:TIGR01212 family radical SAM protein [Candidatus Omnitrophota bacterium]
MENIHKPYYKFSDYLKERFGCRVHKVSVDAGFSCPNRDGTKSKDGCIFCDNKGFSFNVRMPEQTIRHQIKKGIEAGLNKFKAEKFIVYFQSYTNTYAPVNELKEKYDIVKSFYNIAGIAIGTRPDCVNNEVMDLIESYASDFEVWLELGLQSIHDKTLQLINRGHSYSDFLETYQMVKNRGKVKVCAHVIIGLPGETKDEIMGTARTLANLKVDGVKIHPLHVIKGTKLEQLFWDKQYKPMSINEYVDLATEFLEHLWPQTVIQRISADCPKEYLVAPLWLLEKNIVLQKIEDKIAEKESFQGKLYKE